MQSKTFRLFISSTFSDFNQERRLLQTYVFPEIKRYCRELGKGYTFQPIDLRWGVSNEAQLDQKALELCIEEVQSSKSQPHPNFLIMAGNRYGWVPLPYAIEQKEFEAIRENVEDTTLLDTWYQLDNNQLPSSYIIQKRSGEFEAYDTWVKVENSLRDILQKAVNKTHLTNVQKEKYFTSATEAEVIEGIFGYKTSTSFQEALTHKDPNYPLLDSEHLYGYIRDVKSVEDENFHGMFIDEDVTQADQFKDELRGAIKKENLLDVETNLTNLSKDEKNGSLHYAYDTIENEEDSQFVTTMIEFLKQSIDAFKVEDNLTPEKLEAQEQERFKKDKLKLFIDREEELRAIQEYIESDNKQPFVLYGKSGLGKSALMAKAIDNAINEKGKEKVVYRFVGSTASLHDSPSLLISILKELGINEGIRKVNNLQTGQEESEQLEEFYYRIQNHLKDIQDYTVIFIDAIDQVSNKDEFIWLPSKLPSNLKIIISALEDDTYPEDTKYFTDLKQKTSNIYKLGNFEESETLIRSILKQYDRSITETQLTYLQTIYKDVNTPLYLMIAAQEIRHWNSEDKTIDVDPHGQKLASTQKGIITEYIENLTGLYHHDDELVKRVLSYLYLTDGLSEAELLEILSSDEEFIGKVAPETYHYNITTKDNVTKELPSVIWARLHTQLKAFIKLEEKNGQETMSFFHREFHDSISHHKDMKEIHEQLIELIQKLITKYQYDEFESNRWADLYIQIVKDYHMKYEFDYLLNDNSKLKEYTEFLTTLQNNAYLKMIFIYLKQHFVKSHEIYESKIANVYAKIQQFVSSILFNKNKEYWAMYYISSLNNIIQSFQSIAYVREAIKFSTEASEILEDFSNLDPEKWEDDFGTNLERLAYSLHSAAKTEHDVSHYSKIAIELMRKSLEIRKKQFKKNREENIQKYVNCLIGLARILSEQKLINSNQLKEATELLQEAYAIIEDLYIQNENEWGGVYSLILTNLAHTIGIVQKEFPHLIIDDISIEPMYQEALNVIEKLYKINPYRWVEEYIIGLTNLSLSKQNANEKITILTESFEIVRDHFIKNPYRWSEHYIHNLTNLCILLEDEKKTSEAIKLEKDALKIFKQLFLNNTEHWHRYLVTLEINLHRKLCSIGNKDEADALENEMSKLRTIGSKKEKLDKLNKLYSMNPLQFREQYVVELIIMGNLYTEINQISNAIELYEELIEIVKIPYKLNQVGDKDYVYILTNLAALFYRNNQIVKAISLYEETLDIIYELINKQGLWMEEYINYSEYLARSYFENNQLIEAKQLLEGTFLLSGIEPEKIEELIVDVMESYKKN